MASTQSNQQTFAYALPFHRLDVYRVALELVRLVAEVPVTRGVAEARDQARRAAASVALNIAEACGKRGADRRRFFLIARGSALEVGAALDVLEAFGAVAPAAHERGHRLCARIYAMLNRLCGGAR